MTLTTIQKRVVLWLWAALLIGITTKATRAEKIKLEAYASGFDSIPIAILQFRPSSGSSAIEKNEPWKIIANDLAFSGRFDVTRVSKVDSSIFAEKNIGIFVDGEYTIEGNTVMMDCYLHDAFSMDLLYGKKFKGPKKYIRSMAHRYANQLMEMITGDQGPFETKILFVREKSGVKNLFLMDYDGFNMRQLTQSKTMNIFPAFLDSSHIIWTAYYRGKPDLYKGSISSGDFAIFVYSRFVETSPAVSDITGKVAYASSKKGNLDIYSCDSDGSNTKQLTFHYGIDTAPCWSPNGYQIAFTSDRSGQPQIYVMDADGVNTKRITFEGRYQDSPAWSPNGELIAYSSMHKGKMDIWTIQPDGTEAKQITTCPGHNDAPTWSPDGSHIAFVSDRGPNSDIWVVRPDGTGLKQVTRVGDARMPDWSRW